MRKYLIIFIAVLFILGGCSSKSESLFKKAVRVTAAGNTSDALKIYNIILKNDPDYLPALINRALIHEKTGEFKLAEADYERAFKIDPMQPQLLNNMGAFFLSQNKPLMSIYYFNRALEANPDYFAALLNRAAAFEAVDQIARAIEDLDAALAIYPEAQVALEQRAIINLKRLNVADALEDLSKALNMDPFNARNYYRRGMAFKQMHRYANAMQDFNMAIRLNPDHVDALFARATLHFKNVDHYSALGDLEKIKSINNRYVPAYELSGDIYAIEDPVQAMANYVAARQLDPANVRRYNAKIVLMRTEEGRRRVITRTFWE